MKKRYNVLIYNMNSIETNRIKGIVQVGRKHGWNLTFESVKGFGLNFFQNWSGDGVLALFEAKKPHENKLLNLQSRGIPVVDVADFLGVKPRAKVIADNRAIGRLAAEHFIERRHRHALYVCQERNVVSLARKEGFFDRWQGSRESIAIAQDLPKAVMRDYSALMRELGERIKALPKPLAVFTFNDFVAVHVLNACKYMGIAVPQKVSILGVDDNQLLCENQSCPLSSVRHDLFGIGYRAAETLQWMMDHPKGKMPPPVMIQPNGIEVRRSTEYVAVTDTVVQKACSYMLAHIRDSFGAQQIANALKIPRYRLDNRFAKEMGHSVGTELRQMRLSIAKKRLLESDVKLSDLAKEIGFCHAAYFEKVFKREFAITPHQFRKHCSAPSRMHQLPRQETVPTRH